MLRSSRWEHQHGDAMLNEFGTGGLGPEFALTLPGPAAILGQRLGRCRRWFRRRCWRSLDVRRCARTSSAAALGDDGRDSNAASPMKIDATVGPMLQCWGGSLYEEASHGVE